MRPLPAIASWDYRCLHCRAPLAVEGVTLRCSGCDCHYPAIAGIPVLVRDAFAYMHSEKAALVQACADARRRKGSLNRIGRDACLPDESLERLYDSLDSEIARAETLLHLCRFGEIEGETPKGRPRSSGWTVDALLPYLLRDWTGTRELEHAGARIGAALKRVLPAPSGKSVVFAACGAGGLLGELPPEFDRVLGFDLTLPVLAAARCLLDGGSLELALPRAINKIGLATLRRREARPSGSFIALAAMDAFDTAFADDSVDCVVTSFLLDLVSDPHAVAKEIHRILSHGGVWINYGPSGPLKALLRFDEIETPAFIEASGFAVVAADAFRATYLDLSRDCPTWSFQSHICYLTTARKAGPSQRSAKAEVPDLAEIPALVPQHFPGATLIERQSLETARRRTVVLRHERIPGRPKNLELGPEAAQIVALVDGKRTVSEIAALLRTNGSAQPADEIVRAFTRYFEQGLIGWRRNV